MDFSDHRTRVNCPVTEVPGYTMSENNAKVISGATVEECVKQCREEITFHCTSFDYTIVSNTCYLQIVDRSLRSLSAANEDNAYYELDCRGM